MSKPQVKIEILSLLMGKSEMEIELFIDEIYEKSKNEFVLVHEQDSHLILLMAVLKDQKKVQIYINEIVLSEPEKLNYSITEIFGNSEEIDVKENMKIILNIVGDVPLIDVTDFTTLKLTLISNVNSTKTNSYLH